MKVALIYPPTCDPTAPYLSVPTLCAYLRENGVEVLPIDANVEAFDALLRRAPLAELVLAARQKGDGAFPVRTRRALLTPDGTDSGTVREDVVTRLAPLPFPKKLLELPETLRRVPSPLETMVAFAEDEAALRSKGR